MEIVKGGITAAKGYKAAATEAGIKYQNRKDMAMIVSAVPAVTAGTFTTNVVKAAPVQWDKLVVEKEPFTQAVVINAGIANACTGAQGMQYCEETAKKTGELLNIPCRQVLVASTGVIGMQLPMERLEAGIAAMIPELSESRKSGHEAASAIMTTDTKEKEVAVAFQVGGKRATLGGMCKGSGMIHPNMCTMLGFLTTDVAITKELLTEALKEDVKDTFNMISVDGDTSTNDTVLILANGQAGNPVIERKDEDYAAFCEALHYVNETLAKKLAGDGEGATALFETRVIHADTRENARALAKSVICSSLTKAAIFGHDANWGRILCALGYSGVDFDPEALELFFESKSGKIQIYKDGAAADYSEEEATKILSEPEVTVLVDMKMGEAQATAWGCDLTYDYVKINADYRS